MKPHKDNQGPGAGVKASAFLWVAVMVESNIGQARTLRPQIKDLQKGADFILTTRNK